MGKKYKFTQEELEEIMAAKAKNQNKRIDKRLTVLELSCREVGREEIALITGYNTILQLKHPKIHSLPVID